MLTRIFVDHPIQDATDDEMRAKAEAIVDQVIEALSSLSSSHAVKAVV